VADGGPGLGASVSRRWGAVSDRASRVIDRADSFQGRHRPLAVVCAVIRKYSDDRAGGLTAQISHAAFLSVFPMLLVLLALLGIVLSGHKGLQDDVVSSALRQFPVVGADLEKNAQAISDHSTVALAVGVVWLLYGCTRLSRSAQTMMAQVWGIHRDELPTFWAWLPRAAGFLAVLGLGFIAGGAAAGLGAFGGLGPVSALFALVLSLAVNVLMYWSAFVVVVHVPAGERAVWPGALFGGICWTLLQFAGVLLVSHQLRHLTNLYGTFATVLGLVWWLALGALVSVYAAEFNVVLVRRLWPRSLRAGAPAG
jgi:uncharacterized BrkB/YihY/UPF0761 family membrane protein